MFVILNNDGKIYNGITPSGNPRFEQFGGLYSSNSSAIQITLFKDKNSADHELGFLQLNKKLEGLKIVPISELV